MKDFGRWLADMADDLAEPDLLPEDVIECSDGRYFASCRVCGTLCDIYCEPADLDPNMHYCGGSPRCCP